MRSRGSRTRISGPMSGPIADVVLVVPAGEARDRRPIEDQLAAAGLRVRRTSDLPAAVRALPRTPAEVLVLVSAAGSAGDAIAELKRSGYSGAVVVIDMHPNASAESALERDLGRLVLDLRRGVVRCEGVEISLTRREVDLLDYLARNAGHPVTRAELAAHVWHGVPGRAGTNVVDVYVSYLRRKLGAVGEQSLIRSVRGVGYELCYDDARRRRD